MSTMRQTPLTCSGHTRPVVHLSFSEITEHGYFMISACKGIKEELWLFRPFAGSLLVLLPLGFFALWLVRPWLIRPLVFSPLACSPPG